MRIGIIGCGSIGLRHINNLLHFGEKDLILCEVDPQRRKLLAAQFSFPIVSGPEELFRSHIDFTLITSPTYLHLRHALLALRHYSHLFIEKPIAHEVNAQVRHMLQQARHKKLMIFTAQNMRFHPGSVILKKIVDHNTIGKILAARIEAGFFVPDWHPGQDYRRWYMAHRSMGGGVLLDGIHEIDMISWLLGNPKDVIARARTVSDLEIDTEDIAEITLTFEHGALGNVHVDYLQRAYQRSYRLIGSEGTAEWNFHDSYVRVYRAKKKKWKKIAYTFRDVNQMYLSQMKYFLTVLHGRRKKDMFDGREGLRALAVAEAARLSEKTGRRVKIHW